MIELFVEGQKLDINEGFSTLISYAVDDVKDFGAKNTGFTKTIILPGTKTNNLLFGKVFDINKSTIYSTSFANSGLNYNAAVSAKAMIFSDSMQVFKGVLRLMEIIIDNGIIEYEVSVVGELGGFVYNLGNKKLEDLDFSAYDQDYTIANILASWDAAAGTGVYYPHIDYGTYSTNKKDWKYSTFRPALHVAEYLSKIFSGSKYTANFPLMATTRFKNLIVPHNQKTLNRLTSHLISAEVNTTQILIHDNTSTQEMTWDSQTLANFTMVGYHWKYTGLTTISMNVSLSVTGRYYSTLDDLEIWFHKNTPVGVVQNLIQQASTTYVDFSFTYDTTITVSTNDELWFSAAALGITGQYEIEINTATLSIDSTIPTLVPAVLGDSLTMNDALPKNILQKDFFSSILKLFNLYVYEDREKPNQLNITPYIDYYDTDIQSALDWSLKLDRSKPIRIKPLSELSARYYNFKFKSDSDFFNDAYRKRYNDGYGDRIYDSEFEFAEENKSLELVFAATPLVGYSGEDKVYSTIFKSSNAVEENIDCTIRILQRKKITGVASWNILNGAGVVNTGTVYGYAGHFDDPDNPADDLNFGIPKELFFVLGGGSLNVNQFNVYYSAYMAEITDKDSRLFTATFKLNKRDVYNLDLSKFIWIDGTLFRINRITDYNASMDSTCTVELLKVLNTIY